MDPIVLISEINKLLVNAKGKLAHELAFTAAKKLGGKEVTVCGMSFAFYKKNLSKLFDDADGRLEDLDVDVDGKLIRLDWYEDNKVKLLKSSPAKTKVAKTKPKPSLAKKPANVEE